MSPKNPRFLRTFQRMFHNKLEAIIKMVQKGDDKGLRYVLRYPRKGDANDHTDFYVEDIELAAIAAGGLRGAAKLGDIEQVVRSILELVDHTHEAEKVIDGQKALFVFAAAELDPSTGKFWTNFEKMGEMNRRADQVILRVVSSRLVVVDVLLDLAIYLSNTSLKREVSEVVAKEQTAILSHRLINELKKTELGGKVLEQVIARWDEIAKHEQEAKPSLA